MSIQITNSKFVPKITKWIQIKGEMEYKFGKIIDEKKSVEQGLKELQDYVNKLLKK